MTIEERISEVKNIIYNIKCLRYCVTENDWIAEMYLVYDQIQRLHDKLKPCESTEGNTMAVLRMVLNTFDNNDYEDVSVRECVIEALEEITTDKEIVVKEVYIILKKLLPKIDLQTFFDKLHLQNKQK